MWRKDSARNFLINRELLNQELKVYTMIMECASLETSKGDSTPPRTAPASARHVRLYTTVPNLADTSEFPPSLAQFDYGAFVFVNLFTGRGHFYDSHLLECSPIPPPNPGPHILKAVFFFFFKQIKLYLFSSNLFNSHFLVNQADIFTI